MLEFLDDLVKLWGGSPLTESLTCGISSEDINLPSFSSAGTSSSFNNDTNESDEENNNKNIELTNSSQKTPKKFQSHLTGNKRKHIEQQFSSSQRDQLLMNELKEETLSRKNLTDAIRESNETFARSLNQISLYMSTVAQSLARSFEFWSQMMFNNTDQQRHYPSNLSTNQNNFSAQSHNQQGQPLYDTVDSSFKGTVMQMKNH